MSETRESYDLQNKDYIKVTDQGYCFYYKDQYGNRHGLRLPIIEFSNYEFISEDNGGTRYLKIKVSSSSKTYRKIGEILGREGNMYVRYEDYSNIKVMAGEQEFNLEDIYNNPSDAIQLTSFPISLGSTSYIQIPFYLKDNNGLRATQEESNYEISKNTERLLSNTCYTITKLQNCFAVWGTMYFADAQRTLTFEGQSVHVEIDKVYKYEDVNGDGKKEGVFYNTYILYVNGSEYMKITKILPSNGAGEYGSGDTEIAPQNTCYIIHADN